MTHLGQHCYDVALSFDGFTIDMIALDHIYTYAGWQLPNVSTLPTALASWLLEPGSLTARLKAHQPNFRLHVVREQQVMLPEALAQRWQCSQGVVREVFLFLQQQPVVLAQSYLPDTTLRALKPLATLGDQPLGEYIFQQPDLQRGTIEVACFQQGIALPQQGGLGARWGRRSMFSLQQHQLLVQEIFLAGFTP